MMYPDTKREEALNWLRVFPGQLRGIELENVQDATLSAEMETQGMVWVDEKGAWFNKLFGRKPTEDTRLFIYSDDGKKGPYHVVMVHNGRVILAEDRGTWAVAVAAARDALKRLAKVL